MTSLEQQLEQFFRLVLSDAIHRQLHHPPEYVYIRDTLDTINTKLTQLGDMIMATSEQNRQRMEAFIDLATANLAAIAVDIEVIKGQITAGMSQADVDTVQAKLDALGVSLTQLDEQNPTTPSGPTV